MDVDRIPPAEPERDWIAKYRAALEMNPIKPSRISRIRGSIRAAQRSFLTGIVRVFGSKKKLSIKGESILEAPRETVISPPQGRKRTGKQSSRNKAALTDKSKSSKAS
jgi:hypothetical protein